MKRRILASIVGIATLAVVGFGIPLALTIRRVQRDDAIATLEREAARAAIEVPAGATATDPVELPSASASDVSLAVYRLDGTLETGSGPPMADPATAAALRGQLATHEDSTAISIGWPLTANEQTYGAVRAALPTSTFEHRVHVAWALMAALATLVIAVAALFAWWQAGRLARPVAALTDAVDKLGEGDFAVTVPTSGVDDLDRAAGALRATADRLGRLLARERAFSADASHQLRTPLTALRLSLELGQVGETDPQEAFAEALLGVERIEATVDDLLRLARAEHALSEPIELAPLIDEAGRSWNGRFAARGRPLRLRVQPDLPTARAAAPAVRQILDVLLANALDHGLGTATVTAAPTPGGVVVEVSDEGDGIDGDLERIFVRGEGAGNGIGLALARSLAEAEGGRLSLRAAGPNPCFRLLLPAAPDAP